ncbi:oligosaccharide flippase family protein [Bifidobacterium bifidum]|uniref:oligosaccharide flippase family protein n=1 Tax=Bifidobacterium bifidum TaxID=1681 RepID=UPI003CFE7A40
MSNQLKQTHSVKFNAVMNTLLTASSMLVSVITVPYVTRVLSVEGYGDVTFAQNVSQWLSAMCLIGVPTYGLRECARVRDDPREMARVVRELLVIITIFTAVVLAGFGVSILIVPRFRQIAALMWVFLVSTLLLSYGVEWFFQAIEQYKYITIRSMVFKMLSLVAMLVFVRGEDDYLAYGVILALVVCGNNVLNLARMLRMVSFSGLGPMRIGRHLKPLASYAALSIASSVYLAFDSILLGMLSPSNVQVGLYQLASKLKGICFSVINAIIGVLIPRLSYYAKKDPEKYGALLRRGWGFLLNLCLGIALYLLVYAYPLVVLISSEKYADAVLPVRIIGLVNLLSCMSYFFGLCILSPLDQESKLARANLTGAPISLVCNLLLDGTFGATGAAISVCLAELVIFLMQLHDCWPVLREHIDASDVLRTFMSHIMAAAVAFAMGMPLAGLNVAIQVIAGFAVYSVVWLVAALITGETTARWAFGILQGFMKRK